MANVEIHLLDLKSIYVVKSRYLYYTGGKLLYETLHANLNGVLPSITTLYRYKISNAEKMLEGDFNFMGLEKFLETRNSPKIVWISEDATRITGRIEYDPDSNKIVGFVLPFKDGFPDNNKYIAKSAKQIEAYFKHGRRADYA